MTTIRAVIELQGNIDSEKYIEAYLNQVILDNSNDIQFCFVTQIERLKEEIDGAQLK